MHKLFIALCWVAIALQGPAHEMVLWIKCHQWGISNRWTSQNTQGVKTFWVCPGIHLVLSNINFVVQLPVETPVVAPLGGSGIGNCCVWARRKGSTWLEYEYSSGIPASGTNPKFCMNSGWLSALQSTSAILQLQRVSGLLTFRYHPTMLTHQIMHQDRGRSAVGGETRIRPCQERTQY